MSCFQGFPTWVMLLCGSLATIFVKEIPYWVKGLDKLPPFLMKCMHFLPVAAMGALIFPGVFHDYGTLWYAGIGGLVTAFILGYLRRPLISSIIAGILVCFLLLGV